MTETEQQLGADRSGYWNDFYAASSLDRPLPSQFASFVAGELDGPRRIIEFGCGSGRDSVFFSLHGHDVLGVDASKVAVERCVQLASSLRLDARFHAADVRDEDLFDSLPAPSGDTVVYARFFLHAITDEEEGAFLQAANRLTAAGDLLAVEYRTIRDANNPKVTDAHYRRFIHPSSFEARASQFGFRVDYAVEGYGFAKYKEDDAYVARCLLRHL